MQRLLKRLSLLSSLLGLLVFLLVLVALARLLHGVHLREVLAAVRALPGAALGQALGLTGLSYLLLIGYDLLALHHLGRRLPFRRVALTALGSYVLSHNLGLAPITGGSIRYRLYTGAGLSSAEVAGVIALGLIGFSLGVVLVTALALLAEPASLAAHLHVPARALQGVGALLLLLPLTYLLWGHYRPAPLHWRHWAFRPPSPAFGLAQLALAMVDLLLATAVLYVLLPPIPGLSYLEFVGLYVMAMSVGLISYVPGGAGVFEASLLLLLPTVPAPEALLASLLAYRALYYLLPLGVLTVSVAGYGFGRRFGHRLSGLLPAQAPPLLASLVFLAGAVLLLSGALPAWPQRLDLIRELIPLPVYELSHLLSGALGLALLIIARGLYQRLDGAYLLAVTLLAAGVLSALARGLDYASAAVLGVVLLALLPCRALFYRHSSLLREPFTPAWTLAVTTVLLSFLWLGAFAFKYVEYSTELWWQFAFSADAPRFLRASLLVTVLAGGFALVKLLTPAAPAPGQPGPAELDRAAAILAAHSRDTHGHLALTGDKRLLFSGNGREGFLAYAIQGRSWVALGDPVGADAAALAWTFRTLCDRHAARCVFYEVDAENLPLYVDLGLSLLKLGEEALVPLGEFSLQGGTRRELRQAHRHAERAGARFELVPAAAVAALLPELKRLSDDWLATLETGEKRFSVGFFAPDYLRRFPCALVRYGGQPVAFANVLASAGGRELSIDLMRYGRAAPRGVMDYLFVELMRWGQQQGFARFNLGMAPLAGLREHPLAPAWQRVGGLLFRHGEHFYNFAGLRAYKAKFSPEWRPKYLASPGGLDLPRVLLDVSTLIGGGAGATLTRRKFEDDNSS